MLICDVMCKLHSKMLLTWNRHNVFCVLYLEVCIICKLKIVLQCVARKKTLVSVYLVNSLQTSSDINCSCSVWKHSIVRSCVVWCETSLYTLRSVRGQDGYWNRMKAAGQGLLSAMLLMWVFSCLTLPSTTRGSCLLCFCFCFCYPWGVYHNGG